MSLHTNQALAALVLPSGSAVRVQAGWPFITHTHCCLQRTPLSHWLPSTGSRRKERPKGQQVTSRGSLGLSCLTVGRRPLPVLQIPK